MYESILLLLPVAIFGFIVLVQLIATFREKQHIWPLESLDEAEGAEPERPHPSHENPYQSPPSPGTALPLTTFAAGKCHELETLGYQHLGSFRHIKKGIYQVRFEVWISSDRYVVAWIESGSLMTIAQNNLSMLTLADRNADPTALQSVGSPVCVESLTDEKAFFPNIAGTLDTMLFPSASAHEADQVQRQRMAFVVPHRFSDDPLADLHRFRTQEVQLGHDQGRCRFVNLERSIWLPTLVGATRMFIQTWWFMLSRRVYSDRRRLKRTLKRQARWREMRTNSR